MMFTKLLIVGTGSLFVLPASQAVLNSWNFLPTTPQQCANATIVASSNETALPLSLLLVPYGPLPLSDASKKIYEIPFSGPNLTTVDFQVKYPAGTQFIDLVGDASGWLGPTNSGRTVSPNPNNDSACWTSSTSKLLFTFSMYPNRLAQCEETRIYWKADEVQGNPNFLVVVLNDRWYRIIPDIITDVPGYGRGFIWRPGIRIGTVVVIVAGDVHGNATGGGVVTTVGSGTAFTNTTADNVVQGTCPPQNGTGITYPVRDLKPSNAGSFFNAGTAIGVVLGVVSVLVALAILFAVKQRHLGRQNNASVITTPTATEGKRERGVQGQELPGADRQSAFEPRSPNPATQVQPEPGIEPAGWPLYHIDPFPDRSTSMDLDAPSTEVVMHPTTHTVIYTGTGMRTSVPQGPRNLNTTGVGMTDMVMSAVGSSPSPTRGILQAQAHSAGITDNSDGRDKL